MSMAVKYQMKKKMCQGDEPKMSIGGEIAKYTDEGYQSECDKDCIQPCDVHEMPMEQDEDLVSRAMKKAAAMSKGGEVANEDKIKAGFMPNEFDDLALRDGLEFSYTGKNSGDELGDEDPDKEKNDIVARAMMKRRKQSNPRPA